MKYICSLFLAALFFVSVSGINVYKHYCGDFLAEVSVYIQSNPCADEGGEDACSKGKTTSCCDDEIEFHLLDINLAQSQSEKLTFSSNQFVVELLALESNVNQVINLDENTAERAPPNLTKVPIYKRLSRYTFYG